MEINMVVGRLKENVTSIDDVIALLDYIETLKRQDNKVEEIADFIAIMVKKFDYLNSLGIMFDDEVYLDFLNIRNWPVSF